MIGSRTIVTGTDMKTCEAHVRIPIQTQVQQVGCSTKAVSPVPKDPEKPNKGTYRTHSALKPVVTDGD